MLELFLRLIDRFIELAKRREEVNKRFYSEFVTPAYADFEAVHKNYIETFLQYREMILDNKLVLNNEHPVIDLVSRDSLFSDNLRYKLLDLLRLDIDPRIKKFISAISFYMGWAVVNSIEGHYTVSNERYDYRWIHETCSIRYEFKEGLTGVLKKHWGQEEKRKRAIKVLDNIVARTQVNYLAVTHEYNDLKEALLKPK